MIEVRDLRFTYPRSGSEALRGITFDVRPREIFGFLGPSGAGKSTIQKILIGLLRRYAGAVRVRGAAPASHDGFYDRTGVAFEFPNLYGRLTGRENLEFFAALYPRGTVATAELLSAVGLEADGDRRVAAYSKGMRMRLNVARALLNRPDLLFLDEPTTGQDPANARLVRDLIRRHRAEGATVVLTTHDMVTAAELCDRVAFIVDGRIATIDVPRALMLRHGSRRVRVEYAADGAPAAREFELDGLGQDGGFLGLIRTERIERMHTLDATLEDVFIAVTGRALT